MTAAQCVELRVRRNPTRQLPDSEFHARNQKHQYHCSHSHRTRETRRRSRPQLSPGSVLLSQVASEDHHTKLDLTFEHLRKSVPQSSPVEIPRGFQPIAQAACPHAGPPQPALHGPGHRRKGWTRTCIAGLKSIYEEMMELTGLLYRSGIAIEDGTDSMAGFALASRTRTRCPGRHSHAYKVLARNATLKRRSH